VGGRGGRGVIGKEENGEYRVIVEKRESSTLPIGKKRALQDRSKNRRKSPMKEEKEQSKFECVNDLRKRLPLLKKGDNRSTKKKKKELSSGYCGVNTERKEGFSVLRKRGRGGEGKRILPCQRRECSLMVTSGFIKKRGKGKYK